MIAVLGYPGSGTKWASKLVFAAVGNKCWTEEPFSGPVMNPVPPAWIYGPYREKYAEVGKKEIGRWMAGHAHRISVVKEEFGTPYWLHYDTIQRVYILRNTLANVEFLLRWPLLPK
jgi:hypothetical protein